MRFAGAQEDRPSPPGLVVAAVGTLTLAASNIASLAAEYRSAADAPASLALHGDPSRLTGEVGQAALRAVQEALTNAADFQARLDAERRRSA